MKLSHAATILLALPALATRSEENGASLSPLDTSHIMKMYSQKLLQGGGKMNKDELEKMLANEIVTMMVSKHKKVKLSDFKEKLSDMTKSLKSELTKSMAAIKSKKKAAKEAKPEVALAGAEVTITTAPTSTVGPTMVPITPSMSPVTMSPVTDAPVTSCPSTSPITSSPSAYYEVDVSQVSDIPDLCPSSYKRFISDVGKFYYADNAGLIFDLVSPDIADNAGWYLSNGWNRLPVITPSKDLVTARTYAVGNTTVKFHLADQYGNTRECVITVEVVDKESPEFLVCPPNAVHPVDADKCSVRVDWSSPFALDNDPHGVSYDQPQSPSGTVFDLRAEPYPIDYAATDAEGNAASCNFTITVVDTTPPEFTPGQCKAQYSLYEEKCGVVGAEVGVPVTWQCPSSDVCEGSVATNCEEWVEITGDHKFHLINTTQNAMCTAPDYIHSSLGAAMASCNTSYCYVVEDSGTFCAKSYVTIHHELTLDATHKLFFYATSGATFPIPPSSAGAPTHYEVTCSAQDSASNTAVETLSFSVVDGRQPPRFTRCPAGPIVRNLSLADGETSIAGGFLPPLHTTGCGAVMTEIQNRTHETPLAEGHHAFLYTVEDTHGNTATCSFDVVIQDVNEITWKDCPSSSDPTLTLPTDDKLLQYALVNWTHPTPMKRGVMLTIDRSNPLPGGGGTPTSHNYAGPNVNTANITVHYPLAGPQMAFPLGITKVVYTITDHRSYIKSEPICEFYVTVEDREKPKFVGRAALDECPSESVGVPTNEQCGGPQITPVKDPSNFRVNDEYSVATVTANCCMTGQTCSTYLDSEISICS